MGRKPPTSTANADTVLLRVDRKQIAAVRRQRERALRANSCAGPESAGGVVGRRTEATVGCALECGARIALRGVRQRIDGAGGAVRAGERGARQCESERRQAATTVASCFMGGPF